MMDENIERLKSLTERDSENAKLRSELSAGILEDLPDALVVADEAGHIFMVNRKTELMLGYKREELIGQPVEMLLPDNLREAHRGHRTRYGEDPQMRVMGAGLKLSAQRRDGHTIPVEISLSPRPTRRGLFVITIIRRRQNG